MSRHARALRASLRVLEGGKATVAQSENPDKRDDTIASLHPVYGPALARFFQRRILEHADVDDLVQEVFLRLSRRGDLTDITNIGGYIFQTAANVLKDRLRHRMSRQTADHNLLDDQKIDDTAFSPERVLVGKETLSHLSAALAELPDRTQMIFVLCRLEGLQYAAVAKKLGISVSSVDKHMAKAMDHLMCRLKDLR